MNRSEYAKGNIGYPYPAVAGCVVTHRFTMSMTLAMLALGQITEIAAIPADCRPTDIILDCDDMDSATSLTFDVGVMSGTFGVDDAARTIGNEFFAATTLGQAGGVARSTKKEAHRIGASETPRGVGVKITAAPGTAVAGTIGITLSYVAG